MRRTIVIAVVAVVVLGFVVPLAWTLLGWPPPRLILKYGLTPGCEPTGHVKNVEGPLRTERSDKGGDRQSGIRDPGALKRSDLAAGPTHRECGDGHQRKELEPGRRPPPHLGARRPERLDERGHRFGAAFQHGARGRPSGLALLEAAERDQHRVVQMYGRAAAQPVFHLGRRPVGGPTTAFEGEPWIRSVAMVVRIRFA